MGELQLLVGTLNKQIKTSQEGSITVNCICYNQCQLGSTSVQYAGKKFVLNVAFWWILFFSLI